MLKSALSRLGDVMQLKMFVMVKRSAQDVFCANSCFFTNLHICFPFDMFVKVYFNFLNVVPMQIHPNSWASF